MFPEFSESKWTTAQRLELIVAIWCCHMANSRHTHSSKHKKTRAHWAHEIWLRQRLLTDRESNVRRLYDSPTLGGARSYYGTIWAILVSLLPKR